MTKASETNKPQLLNIADDSTCKEDLRPALHMTTTVVVN